MRDSPFEEMTDDLLSPLIDVHLKGAFYVTRPAWKVMRDNGYGRVINTCSAAGLLGAERMSNYGAAKAGLLGFTRVLAAEGARHAIKVNAVAPIAATRMLDYSLRSAAGEGDREIAAEAEEVMRPFLDRLDPAAVTPLVAYLAHRDCAVTGEIYTAGAGHIARFFIGRTQGYHQQHLTVEDVAAHLGQIRDPARYTIPDGPGDEMAALFNAVF